MKMTKTLIVATLLGWGTATQANTYSYLTFQKADSSCVAVALESLSMTFANGKLIATNGADTYELSVVDLSRMFFSNTTPTGIADLAADLAANTQVEVYALTGASLGAFANLRDFEQGAPKGVYVVRTNGRTLKLSVK